MYEYLHVVFSFDTLAAVFDGIIVDSAVGNPIIWNVLPSYLSVLRSNRLHLRAHKTWI